MPGPGDSARPGPEPLAESRSRRTGSSGRGTTAFIIFVLLGGLAAYAAIYASGLAQTPERSDGLCHYVYLPALVLHQDLSLRSVADTNFAGRFPRDLQITWRPGTRRWLNAHQAGVAVMCLPFYMAGRGVASLGDPDRVRGGPGFSAWERHAAGLAAIFYLAAGLYLLARLLSRRFSQPVVLGTLACITFGTNLFHYATYDSLWTHVFSFFLFAAFLSIVESWSEAPSGRKALLAGLVCGLIGLVRLPNLVFVVFFVLYGVADRQSLAARVQLLRERWRDVAIVCATSIVVVFPQILLFRAASGSWWANPYEQFLRRYGIRQAFDFASPQLAEVLFSPAKGLFFWSPVLLLAFAGMIARRGQLRAFLLPTLVFFAVQAYLVASWYDWQLGGSFGHRGFTETLAPLAIPLAAFFDVTRRKPWARPPVFALASLAVGLSIAQMIQYWLGILPMSDITWNQYRSLFLRF